LRLEMEATMQHRWILALALGLIVGMAGPLAPALASSVNSCIDTCFNTYSPPNCTSCSDLRDLCLQQCNKSNNTPAGAYGAVAFGLIDAAEGISWSKGSPAEADRAALATCGKYGNNCKIVDDFSHTCAALGVAKGAQHYTTATADTLKRAEADALNACKRSWGTCLVDLSACSP
jgi:hypothetical protein